MAVDMTVEQSYRIVVDGELSGFEGGAAHPPTRRGLSSEIGWALPSSDC